jgi:hypothetical protein
LSAEKCAKLFELRRKECLLHLTTGAVTQQQKDVLESAATDLKKMPAKSQSQRLRAVLYRLWEQSDTALSSDEFYNNRMELLINQVKERLE